MTSSQPEIITIENEEQIVEPGFVDVELPNQELDPLVNITGEVRVNTNGQIEISESGKLLKQYLNEAGFGDHHIEVYDNWIFKSLYNNVYSRTLLFKDDREVRFENLKVFPARYTRDGKVLPMTPQLARQQRVTYGSDCHVDFVLRKKSTGEELDRRSGICIGTIPIMLKSRNCILHNKNPHDLALMGEDPKDPGGYLIISGVEKTVLLQEQLAVNKIFLMNMDNKGSVVARFTANTPRGTALIELALDKKTKSVIKIRFPSMKGSKEDEKYKSINVLRVFRLFRILFNIDIDDPNDIQYLIAMFMKPEHVKKCMFKLTRNLVNYIMLPDDVEIISTKMEKSKLSDEDKLKEIRRVLDTDLFPHLNNLQGPDNETVEQREIRIAQAKINLLAIMVSRFLEHLAGFRDLDDRDSWSNKRVEGAGRMMEQLFRNAWRKSLSLIQAAIETGSVKDLGGVIEKMKYSVITDTFHDSFITSNWGVKGQQMKNNIAQTLVRDSVVATFAHINTIDVQISRTDRQMSVRKVQNSQWGFVDAISSPEGENCGLIKNLSVTAKVSLDRSDSEIIRLLIGDEERGLIQRVSTKQRDNWKDKMMCNGKFLGWCNGEETRKFLVDLRRTGALPFDMSVIREDDWIYVDISPSRLVRPVLIVDENQQLVIDKLGLRGLKNQMAAYEHYKTVNTFCTAPGHVLLCSGAMEYLSPWEQEYTKIAINPEQIRERLDLIETTNKTYRMALSQLEDVKSGKDTSMDLEEAQNRVLNARDDVEKLKNNLPYTHCEIDPQAILGVAADLIPWPDHNQAPRNTYQVSMGKQALGVYHANHLNRMNDGKTKILAFPNQPMVESDMYDILGLDERAPGENCTVAFMSYPYTEEDSFVFKKEFIDNGGFRMYKYLTYTTTVKHSGEVIERLTKPDPRVGEPEGRYKFIQQEGQDSPLNGLPMIGAPLRQGDCVIGKIQHVPATGEIRNESVILRVGDEGVVEKVLVTSDNKSTTVTVKLRIMRLPIEGDKFAPRCAQKGTIGYVFSEIDLPTNEFGIAPDIIVNPSSIPSRMTISYLMELHAAKYGALRGTHYNGGPFQPYKFNEIRKTLKEYGHHEMGYETLRSGTSGKPLKAPINMGPVFFQALRHHVKDKIQARSTGQVKPMTRQPPKGELSPMWWIKPLQVPITRGNTIKFRELPITIYYQISFERMGWLRGKLEGMVIM